MSSLIQTPNGWSLPETLRQGQSYMGGTVNFDTTTGQQLARGATTLSRPMGSPSYQNLTSNPPIQGGTVTPPPALTNTNSSDLYFQLKSALQAQQKGYAGNNTALLMGKQNINQTNADVYSGDLANANMRPNDLTSLLGNDQGLQSGGLKSIADQQKNNIDNYNSQLDAFKVASDNYQKEQDRIQKTKSDALDRAAGPKLTASEKYDQTLGSYANGFESTIPLPDGSPIRDTNGYVTPAAWKSAMAHAVAKGIKRKDFIAQYGNDGYLYTNDLSNYGFSPKEITDIMGGA